MKTKCLEGLRFKVFKGEKYPALTVWTKIDTERTCREGDNVCEGEYPLQYNYGVLVGKYKPGKGYLTVIDIDLPKREIIEPLLELFKEKTMIVKTRKGKDT